MTECFADTSYFIALISEDDECHAEAVAFTESFDDSLVTTAWVINELANFLARPPNRQLFLEMLAELEANPRVKIIPVSDADYRAGLRLFAERPDKEWSLVDCISFLVMDRMKITSALTKDHHFKQAGFTVVLG